MDPDRDPVDPDADLLNSSESSETLASSVESSVELNPNPRTMPDPPTPRVGGVKNGMAWTGFGDEPEAASCFRAQLTSLGDFKTYALLEQAITKPLPEAMWFCLSSESQEGWSLC